MLSSFGVGPAGRKEVGEEVLKAALIALATGFINWGLERLKERAKEKKQHGGSGNG